MTKIVFRESAANQYAETEQIDGLLQVMRPSAWWWLSACALVIVAALLWSFFGEIISRVTGEGIIVHEGGGITRVLVPKAGRLKSILVKEGERITANQVIGQLEQPLLEQKVAELESALAKLKQMEAVTKLKQTATAEKAGEGEKTQDPGPEIQRLQALLKEAQSTYKYASNITAGRNGVIATLLAQEGQLVERYQPLCNLETGADGLQALVFFDPVVGKELQKGQTVEISPSSSNSEEKGFFLGTVTEVSNLPLSSYGLRNLVEDDTLVALWTSKYGAPIAARVDFVQDSSLPNKSKWTSARGKQANLSAGTLVRASVRVKVSRVISLIIPTFEKVIGE